MKVGVDLQGIHCCGSRWVSSYGHGGSMADTDLYHQVFSYSENMTRALFPTLLRWWKWDEGVRGDGMEKSSTITLYADSSHVGGVDVAACKALLEMDICTHELEVMIREESPQWWTQLRHLPCDYFANQRREMLCRLLRRYCQCRRGLC